MNKLSLLCIVASSLIGCDSAMEGKLKQKNLWSGTIEAAGQKVVVNLGCEKSWAGSLKCSISIPQQGIFELPASETKIEGDSLKLVFADRLTAKYATKLDRELMIGQWSQGGYTFPLNLKQTNTTIYQLYAEYALNLAKENSLYSNLVNWSELRQEVFKQTRNASSTEELIPALQTILQGLKDAHGFIYFNNKNIGYEADNDQRITPALKRAAHGRDSDIVSKMIADSIGYLRVPRSPELKFDSDKKFTMALQKQVCNLMNEGVKHWVVDLRLNYGGNMFDMLNGINQLVGDGDLGAFINKEGHQNGIWRVNGVNEKAMTSSDNACKIKLKRGKIAVLTGPVTASSGEAVGIAFRGLENTVTIGEPTKGRSTSLKGFKFGEDILFMLSTCYYADSKGQVYRNGITPDIMIKGGDDFDDIKKDVKVIEVVKWINN